MKRGDRNEKKLVICYKNGMDVLYNIAVAPLAGAWIEIRMEQKEGNRNGVAPLAGAWTEKRRINRILILLLLFYL